MSFSIKYLFWKIEFYRYLNERLGDFINFINVYSYGSIIVFYIVVQVKTETGIAQENVENVLDDIGVIEDKLKTLQTGFLKNVRDANEVKSEAKMLTDDVQDTERKSTELLTNYDNVNSTLENRFKNSKSTLNDSQRLLERASQLSANTTLKLKELKGKW